jgi:hypothetical protein
MDATRSSETSVDFERATRRYIPEYITVVSCFFPKKDISFQHENVPLHSVSPALPLLLNYILDFFPKIGHPTYS